MLLSSCLPSLAAAMQTVGLAVKGRACWKTGAAARRAKVRLFAPVVAAARERSMVLRIKAVMIGRYVVWGRGESGWVCCYWGGRVVVQVCSWWECKL